MLQVTIIGGGLAGTEAALQLANHGHQVLLYEMRPSSNTPAHRTDQLAELICSNSLKSLDTTKPNGLLKEELSKLGSVLLKVANEQAIPSGHALVVDRNSFAHTITKLINDHSNITLRREHISAIPDDRPLIIATGPLTSDAFAHSLKQRLGSDFLSFYDAIAPIVSGQSIDFTKAYALSRYGKGAPLWNCPFTKEEYLQFYHALTHAEQVLPREFEKAQYFEACLPIEEIAKRGTDALRFGPMRPVGLESPDYQDGKRPYAVLQLRPENIDGSAYGLIGCQTRMTYGEQAKVFRLIPALHQAEFIQLGSMHRNTFVNAPKVIKDASFELRALNDVYLAGQLVGSEGYVEAITLGTWVGLALAHKLVNQPIIPPPETSILGALIKALTTEKENFQPVKATYGLMDIPLIKGKINRRNYLAERAKKDFDEWLKCVIL